MKFNWGTGIFIFILIFLSLAIAFMIFAFNQEINLVHEDYYQKGVDFDQEIATEKRSAEFYDKINISEKADSIFVIFDNNIKHKVQNIEYFFYSPSDKNYDMKFNAKSIDKDFIVAKKLFKSGRFIVKISFEIDGVTYRVDKEFVI